MTIDSKLFKHWSWGLGAMALFLFVVWQLKALATLALLSFIVAYILNPVVTRLARLRFINRTAGTVITLLGLLVGFLMVLFVILPGVVEEFQSFLDRLPSLIGRLQSEGVPWLEKLLGRDLPSSFDEVMAQYDGDIKKFAPEVLGPASVIARQVLGSTFSVVFAILGTLMFPLFLFFLLKDFPRIVDAVYGLVPLDNKDLARRIARDVDQSLSNFLHGQFMVMLVLGTLYSIGFTLVDVPVSIGVGLLTGMLCFIPYVGAAAGFGLALLLTLLDFTGFGRVLGVAAVFGGVQLLDAVLITPRIIGGKLGLTPLWIIMALMAGAELFGFLGVLLAVPTTAVLKVLVVHTIDRYKRSEVYKHEPSTPDAASHSPESEASASSALL